jgi:PilZ domain
MGASNMAAGLHGNEPLALHHVEKEAAMDLGSLAAQKRPEPRIRMVLPLRVSAKSGPEVYSAELAHTLDISSRGARLGAIRYELKVGTGLVIEYRQRKIQSRVVWIKRLEGTSEYQVGVQLLANGADTWGIDFNTVNTTGPEPEVVTL